MSETTAPDTTTGGRFRLSYPTTLPITAQRPALLDVLRDHQVVVVAGETGSGKSTQLPKLCLELGRGRDKLIGHTQPRRLAARTVASRIAEELDTAVGDVVGYKVRFSDQVSDSTQVKLMTDGVLLAELRSDPDLQRYDTLIVDEAHERSLNIDFLLGYLTDLLPRRPDLKVIVTSATIDTERFGQHFDAPVVEVSGRSYPVEVRYRPLDGEGDENQRGRGVDQVDAIRLAVDELRTEGPGDILVFLSGQREIRDTATALTEARLPDTEILPLYARLSAAEQQRVFRPHRGRRVILATNVAETSITVPGVRYVVDTGTARISRYNRRTKVQRLPIEAVSQASADQRAGRCGRVAAGVCLRLYSQEDYDARPEFTEPETLRTNLASVILQMAGLGLGEVESFPFVDPPDARAVKDAVSLLVELRAMREDRSLTRDGRRLARLPVDPRFGRMLLEAEANGCRREVTIIVAALSIQDPRQRPSDNPQAADQLHARFRAPGSDFLAYLNLWEYLSTEQRRRSGNQFRRMCRDEHLHYVRVREWQDLVRQLREAGRDLGLRRPTRSGGGEPGGPRDRQAEGAGTLPDVDADAVHRSLLAGLLSHVGLGERTTRDYRGARQSRFTIGRGSALSRNSPAWVMAGELVETNRLWARDVARIDPSWIEPLADHLVKRTYSEARWSRKQGTAVTDERVLLYGLPIVDGRPVPLGRVDPVLARAMFIDHALVGGDWEHGRHPFLEANERLVDQVQDLAARSRRNDLVLTEDRLAELYDQRIPASVVSVRHFESWWKSTRQQEPDRLSFTVDDLVGPEVDPVRSTAFPRTWTQDGLDLELSYVFEPGADDDGVTVHVPLPLLPRVSPDGFEWNVPGHRLDLLTSLLRTLPKHIRRDLVPAPEYAQEAMAAIDPADGALLPVLAGQLARMTGGTVGPQELGLDRLPDHLRMRFQVEEPDGSVVAAGRDLEALQRRLADDARRAVAAAVACTGGSGLEARGLGPEDVGSLPRTVETAVGRGQPAVAYPTLVDEGGTVGIRVLADPGDRDRHMWAGTRRLLLMTVPEAGTQVERRLRGEPTLATTGPDLPGPDELAQDCLMAAADRLLTARGGPAWDEAEREPLLDAARERLPQLAAAAAGPAAKLVAAADRLDRRLQEPAPPDRLPALEDLRSQLAHLVYPGFVAAAGVARLPDLARYLEAMQARLARMREKPERGHSRMRKAQALEAEFDKIVAALAPSRRDDPDVDDLRWLLEELRVSFFAEKLGTARPVSEQRIRKALAALR